MPISDYYRSLDRYEATRTANGRGGATLGWVKAETFQGLINQASSQEVLAAGQLGIVADHKLFCGVAETIERDMLIGEGDRVFRVVSQPKNTVNRGHHLRVMLRETSLDDHGV